MPALEEFKSRLSSDWLIPFCSAKGYPHDGFVVSSLEKLSSTDARDFMEAIDSDLVLHHQGIFTAARSKAKEQIFWQCARTSVPRKITLWLEPIITIAGLMRLHRDFGWASNRLGMQSKTWAFDLVGYEEDLKTELLVCEVKKTEREVDKLLELMEKHASTPAEAKSNLRGTERNALKKVVGLRQSTSTMFWALGPNRYGHVFHILRSPAGIISLHPTGESALSLKTPRSINGQRSESGA